jgi:hypothetical protein
LRRGCEPLRNDGGGAEEITTGASQLIRHRAGKFGLSHPRKQAELGECTEVLPKSRLRRRTDSAAKVAERQRLMVEDLQDLDVEWI